MLAYESKGDNMAKRIKSIEDIETLVGELGFLPFFACGIPGFSLEERIEARHWFTGFDDAWDAWEWKGPIARGKKCVYGKLFNKKAGFVGREWYPDLANWRRDGYDFDALYDDGKASHDDKLVYDIIDQREDSVLSKEIKKLGGFGKSGKKGFDTIITRLQMECYLVVADFTYMTDKKGNRYGWGVARYTTPEKFYGASFTERVYRRTPEESRERLLAHFRGILPKADERQILKLIG